MSRTAFTIATAACSAAALILVGSGRLQPAPAPAAKPAAAMPVPAKEADPGYAIGFDIGRDVLANLKRDGVPATPDAVIKGFTDALRGTAPTISESEMAVTLANLQKSIDERSTQERMRTDPVFRAAAEQDAERSKTFLAKFGERPQTQKLPGGILYEVVRAGSGEPVKNAPVVMANYLVYLSSGELVTRGDNARVVVDQLVPGGQQTLAAMKVGDRWYVAIPPDLAFGERGQGARIGPNEAIVVDVEVTGIAK